MNELRSTETCSDFTTLSLNDQTKFRLHEINKRKDYFEFDIKERETMSKKLSKFVASLEYMDKILIVLSETSGGVSIISHLNVIGISAGIISSRKKKKKHTKIVMLAKSKLNSTETLMSQALIDLEISHEEFKTTVNKKDKYDQMKESIRNKKDGDEFSENE